MGLQPDISDSKLTITPLLDGRFVRMDYTWGHHGKPQSGSILIGHHTKTHATTLHWIDSWHNGESVMACKGRTASGSINVLGSYAAPPRAGLEVAHRHQSRNGIARDRDAQTSRRTDHSFF